MVTRFAFYGALALATRLPGASLQHHYLLPLTRHAFHGWRTRVRRCTRFADIWLRGAHIVWIWFTMVSRWRQHLTTLTCTHKRYTAEEGK